MPKDRISAISELTNASNTSGTGGGGGGGGSHHRCMVSFRVRHPRIPGSDAWWRAYSIDGSTHDCGLSSNEMLSDSIDYQDYETENTVFAWMPHGKNSTIAGIREDTFSPHEILPIPSTCAEQPEFVFEVTLDTQDNNTKSSVMDDHIPLQNTLSIKCHPSHSVVYISNESSLTLRVAIEHPPFPEIRVLPQVQNQELAFVVNTTADSTNGTGGGFSMDDPIPVVIQSFKGTIQTTTTPGATLEVSEVKEPSRRVDDHRRKGSERGGGGGGSERGDIDTKSEDSKMTDGGGLTLTQIPFSCPIPVYDIPIRCINRSGKDAKLRIEFEDETIPSQEQTVPANQPPFIVWVHSTPTRLVWSITSKTYGGTKQKVKEPYASGMTLTIRSPEAVKASELLLNAEHNKGAREFVELLESVGELIRCAPLFANHHVEYSQLAMLSNHDWDCLGVKVGSKLRILGRLTSTAVSSSSSPSSLLQQQCYNTMNQQELSPSSYHSSSLATQHHQKSSLSSQCTYDLFICHRQEGGEDLAQAIKLQLQVMFPDKNLRVFLDVDNLQDLSQLQQHVVESHYFLLLLTPGVLERPCCRSQIQVALAAQRKIILVHDVKKCSLPDKSTLSEDLRPVLDGAATAAAIPYMREHYCREAAMRQIAKAMELIP